MIVGIVQKVFREHLWPMNVEIGDNDVLVITLAEYKQAEQELIADIKKESEILDDMGRAIRAITMKKLIGDSKE